MHLFEVRENKNRENQTHAKFACSKVYIFFLSQEEKII